jgi:hypothetical protein
MHVQKTWLAVVIKKHHNVSSIEPDKVLFAWGVSKVKQIRAQLPNHYARVALRNLRMARVYIKPGAYSSPPS